MLSSSPSTCVFRDRVARSHALPPRSEVFAVLFTQTIHDHIYVDMLPMPTDAEVASDRYFGSLLDSMLRPLPCHGRFCIVGYERCSVLLPTGFIFVRRQVCS